MKKNAQDSAPSGITRRLVELGHSLVWSGAHKETGIVNVNGRRTLQMLWVVTGTCSCGGFTKTTEGRVSYDATRSAIRSAWRKDHSRFIQGADLASGADPGVVHHNGRATQHGGTDRSESIS